MTIELRLAAATEALHDFHATTRLADQLRARVDAAGDELAVLRNRLDEEQQDVDELEKLSLVRLLSSLRGDRDDALAKQRAEAEEVRFQVAGAKARFDAVRAEHLAARDRLAALAKAPAEHAAALEELERDLADSGDPRGPALRANAELRGQIGGELRELRQALGAADNAHLYLAEVRDRITGAALTSAWQAVRGPGVNPGRRQAIAEAVDKVAEGLVFAEEWLASLRAELADLGEPMPDFPDLAIRLPRLAATFYVDDLPLNDATTEAITQAGDRAATALSVLDALRTRLEAREATLLTRLEAAESDRAALHATRY